MLLKTHSLTAWIAANIVASAAFLHFASWTWLEPNLRGEEVGRGGDALVWMMSAFPILVGAALANLMWLMLVAQERRRTEAVWPLSPTIVVVVIWISALTIDRLRSAGF